MSSYAVSPNVNRTGSIGKRTRLRGSSKFKIVRFPVEPAISTFGETSSAAWIFQWGGGGGGKRGSESDRVGWRVWEGPW